MINYFPLGIASGESFCNRVDERQKIIENINVNRHTLVKSPRRYGKSSLVLYAFNESSTLYERVDLFVAIDERTVQDLILAGVKRLLNRISKSPENIIRLIRNYIKKLKTKFTINTDGVSVELISDKENDPIATIINSLQLLDHLLQKKKLSAVFFIDEFQEIGLLTNSKALEGAIRHVAQESKRLCFIFSGSNRHLLSNMFDKRSRPLYMLCDRINLGRIEEESYIPFLNKLASKKWNKTLSNNVIQTIFECTQRHPYYMNVICGQLWQKDNISSINAQTVKDLWKNHIMQEESKTAKELSVLTTLQKELLIAIARDYTKDLSGKAMLSKLNVTSAAVIRALNILNELDYIKKNKGEYSLIDPLIQQSLLFFYSDKR